MLVILIWNRSNNTIPIYSIFLDCWSRERATEAIGSSDRE